MHHVHKNIYICISFVIKPFIKKNSKKMLHRNPINPLCPKKHIEMFKTNKRKL